MQKITNYLTIAIALVLSIIACKKDNTKAQFDLDKSSYQQLEVASILAKNVELTESIYSATVGGQSVDLVKSDSLLVFVVPDVTPGSYEVVFTVEEKDYSLPLSVSATPEVANPATFVESKLDVLTWDASELDSVISWTSQMIGDENDMQNKTILLNYLTEAQNELSAMSSTDKAKLARFFSANSDAFEPLEDFSLLIDSTNIHRFGETFRLKLENAVEKINVSKIQLVALVAVTVGVCATTGVFTGGGACIVAGTALVYKLYKHNKLIAATLDKVFVPMEVELDNLFPRNFTVQKDTRYALAVSVGRRTLYNSDMTSSDADMQGMVNILNQSESVWNQVMQVVPTDLIGSPNHIKNETTYQSKPITEKDDVLTVGNISNPSVTISSQTYSTDELVVEFTTTETTDQNFTFDVLYDDGLYQLSETVTATLTVSNNNGHEMITIIGGTFNMGCIQGDTNCTPDESPAHSVTLSTFRMSKYETTNIQFAVFLNAMGNQTEGSAPWYDEISSYARISFIGGVWVVDAGYENYPVTGVTWYGATAYCTWAGGRLPTEAQWEYAARGGNLSNNVIYAGSSNVDDVAIYYSAGNYSEAQSVGQKSPNEMNLYDMSGNVWEWCSDWNGPYNSSAQTNPTGPNFGSYKILRGGGWLSNAVGCRVSYRICFGPGHRTHDSGFRLVLVP